MKNVVLQAMGQTQHVTVAIGRLELRRGDRLLLCSDGLSNKVDDDDICRLASVPLYPAESTTRLIQLANEHGGEDNITVVVAEVDGDDLAEHQPVETVTQTLHVVSEYSGGVARVEEDEHPEELPPPSAPTAKSQPDSARDFRPVVSDAPEIQYEALDTSLAPGPTETPGPPKHIASGLYSSLLAVAVGVLLALLVIWLFLGH
jgi:hypothetical protein